jgi:hypothetical protein
MKTKIKKLCLLALVFIGIANPIMLKKRHCKCRLTGVTVTKRQNII